MSYMGVDPGDLTIDEMYGRYNMTKTKRKKANHDKRGSTVRDSRKTAKERTHARMRRKLAQAGRKVSRGTA